MSVFRRTPDNKPQTDGKHGQVRKSQLRTQCLQTYTSYITTFMSRISLARQLRGSISVSIEHVQFVETYREKTKQLREVKLDVLYFHL